MHSDFTHRSFAAQDQAIAIVAADLNPAMMNPDILRYSGVIPAEWEIKGTPVYTPRQVHIAFTNGVNILAEGHQVMFAEPFEADTKIVTLAQQFIRAFPNLQYKGSTLNLRGYLPTEYPPGRYVADTWLARGLWQDDCVRAALNLVYKRSLTDADTHPPLELALTEAMMKTKAEKDTSIVLFTGRYGYAAKGETSKEIGAYLAAKFEGVQTDIEHYLSIVNQKFVSLNAGLPAKELALSGVS